MSVEPNLKLLDALTTLAAVAKEWRKAEKRHALIVIGELNGDAAAVKLEADKALHLLRIAADKLS